MSETKRKTAEGSGMSFRIQILIVLSVGIVVLAITASLFTSWQVTSLMRASFVADGMNITQQFAEDSTLALVFQAPENAQDAAKATLQFTSARYVSVYDVQGNILYKLGDPMYWHPPPDLDLTGGEATPFHESPRLWHFVAPVYVGQFSETGATKERVGYVHVAISKEVMTKITNTIFFRNVTASLLFAALLIPILLFVTHRITDPLLRLSKIMMGAQSARPTLRAALTGPREVQTMSLAFNEMMALIEQQTRSLEAHTRDLERLVEERTQELVIARDKELKLNKENRALIKAMNQRLEDERKYIAREIHDELNATLVAIKLQAWRTRELLDGEHDETTVSELSHCADSIVHMIDDIYGAARNIVHQLRPEVIDSLGLVGAVEEIVSSYRKLHTACRFDLQMSGDVTALGDEVEMAIYRIIQESLANIVKHADATHVEISLLHRREHESRVLCLSISDNGTGFDVEDVDYGVGIISMRERAYALGGELTVTSRKGDGTRIAAKIPLRHQQMA